MLEQKKDPELRIFYFMRTYSLARLSSNVLEQICLREKPRAPTSNTWSFFQMVKKLSVAPASALTPFFPLSILPSPILPQFHARIASVFSFPQVREVNDGTTCTGPMRCTVGLLGSRKSATNTVQSCVSFLVEGKEELRARRMPGFTSSTVNAPVYGGKFGITGAATLSAPAPNACSEADSARLRCRSC